MSVPRESLYDDPPEEKSLAKAKVKSQGKPETSTNLQPNGLTDKKTGKFGKGNKGGPGNPFAGDVQKNRKVWLSLVREKRVRKMFFAMYRKGLQGDVKAMMAWLDRSLGKVPDLQITKEYTAPEDPNESDLALAF